MFLIVFLLFVVLILARRRRIKRVRLLYTCAPHSIENHAVFPCGCKFDLANPAERIICQSHKAIIEAEIAA